MDTLFQHDLEKIKVYVLTIGETPAARDENLRKYGEWVKTLQR